LSSLLHKPNDISNISNLLSTAQENSTSCDEQKPVSPKKKVPKDREKPHHGTITEKSGGSEIHRSLEFHDQFSATTIETRHTMKTPEKIAESESST
jgi:hypothetical protein